MSLTTDEIAETAIIIPWQYSDPARVPSKHWVIEQYESRGFKVFVGELPVGAPWIKAAAVDLAVRSAVASGQKLRALAIADADVWVTTWQFDSAVKAILSGEASWAIPFSMIVRFTADASARVLSGAESAEQLAWVPGALAEREYSHVAAGGLVVIDRVIWDLVPMDPRFVGFGGEDFSWADALSTLAGLPKRYPGRLYHFWHPPQQRISRQVGSHANLALRRRYQGAKGRASQTLRLIEEAKALLNDIAQSRERAAS